MKTLSERIEIAAHAVRAHLPADFTPRALVILGTGLGELAETVPTIAQVPYSAIPGFAVSTVPGHVGRLVAGRIGPTPILLMQGRLHYYEGYNLDEVTFPVRVAQALGADTLLVTNAAGGLNPAFRT